MKRRFRSTTTLFALAAAVTVPTCATMNVAAHMQPGWDVGAYRSYGWGPPDAVPIGDPRLEANPFFDARVRSAVEAQLAARGLVKVQAGEPDLLVHYHASVEQRLDVFTLQQEYGSCTYDCPQGVREFEQGTLVIDVVDRRTTRVVWRAWAQTDISGLIDDQRRLEKRVDEAVRRMFELFPSTTGSRVTLAEPLAPAALTANFGGADTGAGRAIRARLAGERTALESCPRRLTLT